MDFLDGIFEDVDRKLFISEELKEQAYVDAPLPIGFGQTISQPSTVKKMLEWLGPLPGEKILDIGSGSGWTTAVLATIVGPKGMVYAVERIPELMALGKQNCLNFGIQNAVFFKSGKNLGLVKFAPYNRILVSAAANILPTNLINQLKIGGKLVMPVNHTIFEITKDTSEFYSTKTHPGFAFVPLFNQ